MTFDDFIAQNNGKGIDWDGAYGFQCMDLAHAYASKVVGTDFPAAPAAKDVWGKSCPGFDKIANTPSGVPQKGDIMIWGTEVGPYGHIAVFIDGNTNTFNSFDQNWPTNSLCHKQPHSYKGVLGWLHPKQTVSDTVAVSKADFERVMRKSAAYDQYCAKENLDINSTDGAKMIAVVDELRRSITEKEAELQTTRSQRDEAVSKVCPDPSSHTGNSSSNLPTTNTPGDTHNPSDSIGSNSAPNDGQAQPDTSSLSRFIAWLLKNFK